MNKTCRGQQLAIDDEERREFEQLSEFTLSPKYLAKSFQNIEMIHEMNEIEYAKFVDDWAGTKCEWKISRETSLKCLTVGVGKYPELTGNVRARVLTLMSEH